MRGSFNLKQMRETHTTAKAKLGYEHKFPDGSLFRYALAGAGNLTVGMLCQSPLPIANHVTQDCLATAIGATQVSVVLGATALEENFYQDGTLFVHTGTGEGYYYRIKSHPAAAASATVVVTLYDDNPIKVALAASGSTKVSLIPNSYRKVLAHASPPTAEPVGWAPVAVTAGNYFWLQVKGILAPLVQGTLVIGDLCVPSATVDGAVMPSAALETDGPPVGKVISIGADGEYGLIRGMLE